ncbi:tetratricopeptide repeat protein [Oscillatoria sp. FACHB-1406]|uniref:tetratricopeptide repeat protein n=1 Tax=Oscillatoria sp. FACHB-1406 TaxID=2692846 RepID=UPI0016871F6B|nr:tetratricopeptide repeat protein [Oscillatoria sp. FACHB-1406]MBD2576532.1 tetratricopeptide repeat protein [Oscillatoria sp. FACHB-1406]
MMSICDRALHLQHFQRENLNSFRQTRSEKLVFVPPGSPIDPELQALLPRYKQVLVKGINWLQYQSSENEAPLTRSQNNLKAFDAFCELELWSIARELLWHPFDAFQDGRSAFWTPLAPVVPTDAPDTAKSASTWAAFLVKEGFYQEEIQIYSKLSQRFDRAFECFCLYKIAAAYHALGRFWKAKEFYQQQLELARAIDHRGAIVQALNGLGRAFHKQMKNEESLKYHHECLALAEQLQDAGIISEALYYIHMVYDRIYQFKTGMIIAKRALNLAQAIKCEPLEGVIVGSVGMSLVLQAKFKQALPYLQQQLSIANQAGTQRDRWISLRDLGGLYTGLGDYDRALSLFNEALKLAGGSNLYSNSVLYYDIAFNCIHEKQYKAAVDFFKKSRKNARKLANVDCELNIYYSLSYCYACLKQFSQARRAAWKLLCLNRKLQDRVYKGYGLLVLANVDWHTGKKIKALKLLIGAAIILFKYRNLYDVRYAFGVAFDTILDFFKRK